MSRIGQDARAGDSVEKSPVRPHTRRTAHHTLLFGLSKHKKQAWWLVVLAVAAVAVVFFVLRYTNLTYAEVLEWIAGLNPLAVVPLMALLPIVGFPISVVYLVAGARFGPVLGGVVVTVVTTVHLLGTYLIARSFLRAPLQRFIERRHAHLPEIPVDEQAAVCLIAALVPGLPYVVRNYLLALAGVRLRYYLGVCLPIYVARSYVTILLGDMTSDPSRTKIILLIIVDILKVAICALVIWRLREHHRKYHGHHEPEAGSGPAPAAVVPPSAAAK
jgi:uncharacterized membrane protein YdjX (TVP38/TMEM64 family)